MASEELREYARLGAEQRLQALDAEREQILQLFPELRRGGKASGTRRGATAVRGGRKRQRRAMSAEERAAVGERMRAYWAARRAEKGGAAANGAEGAQKTSGRRARRGTGRKK